MYKQKVAGAIFDAVVFGPPRARPSTATTIMGSVRALEHPDTKTITTKLLHTGLWCVGAGYKVDIRGNILCRSVLYITARMPPVYVCVRSFKNRAGGRAGRTTRGVQCFLVTDTNRHGKNDTYYRHPPAPTGQPPSLRSVAVHSCLLCPFLQVCSSF
jgi:hypothetical protein